MISPTEFRRLRLSAFVPDVAPLSNWQFMGRTWIGEAAGSTEWLRPVEAPTTSGRRRST